MVAHARAHGGAHTLADFAAHRCDWVTPLAHDYHGHTLHEIPPNGQGIAALMALGILEHFDLGAQPADAVAMQHLEIEAMKLAFADVYRYVSDPRDDACDARAVARPRLSRRARALIDPQPRAGLRPRHAAAAAAPSISAAADERGMMVSLIQSNYMGFGSGIVVPGTGISLQNRGTGFSLEPDHPNLVGAGKRPFHTIIPGFAHARWRAACGVRRDGRADAAAGASADAGAADRLPANPQAVLDAPRWKVNGGLSVDLEADARHRCARACARSATRSRPFPIRTWISAPASSSCAASTAISPARTRGATARPQATDPGTRSRGPGRQASVAPCGPPLETSVEPA